MFESLSERLQGIFRTLRGQGVLTEAQVDAALREVRLALLEADVHFQVTKQLVERVRERAIGQDVLKSLSPDQAVLRIVRDEMVEALGGAEAKPLVSAKHPPSVILMTGLQGSGKTTTTAKLGRFLAGRGRHPLLVSTDVQRPAAREQLRTVGAQAGVKVHHPRPRGPARDPALGARRGPRGRPRHRPRRHRRPPPHRRRADGGARRAAGDRRARRGAVRRRRADRPGRGAQRRRVPSADRDHRHRAHQARRRLARRRRALRGRGHRAAGQVRGHGREGGRARALRPRAHGLAHPRHGRRARPDRDGRGDGRAASRPRSSSASCAAPSSRSRTTATS